MRFNSYKSDETGKSDLRFRPAVLYSLGIRCHTEIFLKNHSLRMFSSILGSANCKTLETLRDILKTNFAFLKDRRRHISTAGIGYYQQMNRSFGPRTLVIGYDNILNYHSALLPHHDLTEEKSYKHFMRGLERLEKLSNLGLPILFIITANIDDDRSFTFNYDQTKEISDQLLRDYNAHTLVILAGYSQENKIFKSEDREILINNKNYNFYINKESPDLTIVQHKYSNRYDEELLFHTVITNYFNPNDLVTLKQLDSISC